MLERQHDVRALTLPGRAGGPPINRTVSTDPFVDAVERAMDEAGLQLADLVGNSFGGYVARRARSGGKRRGIRARPAEWAPGRCVL